MNVSDTELDVRQDQQQSLLDDDPFADPFADHAEVGAARKKGAVW